MNVLNNSESNTPEFIDEENDKIDTFIPLLLLSIPGVLSFLSLSSLLFRTMIKLL